MNFDRENVIKLVDDLNESEKGRSDKYFYYKETDWSTASKLMQIKMEVHTYDKLAPIIDFTNEYWHINEGFHLLPQFEQRDIISFLQTGKLNK